MKRLLANPRFRRLAANSFEVWIATAAIQTAITFLIKPEALTDSAIGRVLHPWDFVWNLSYGVAGVILIAALVRFRIDWELVGLVLICGALAIQVTSLVSIGGWAVTTTVDLDVGFVLCAAGRVWSLLHGRDRVVLSRPEEFYGGTA